MSGIVLDAGALVAFERSDRRVVSLLARTLERSEPIVVPAGVVAQVWRNGSRQARLARLLGSPNCEVVALDDRLARAAGQVCGLAGTADVVDASVVVVARERDGRVVSSDPDHLRLLDYRLEVIVI